MQHGEYIYIKTTNLMVCVDVFQDQHTNALERVARRGSSLQRLLCRPVPWSGQTGCRRQNGDEAYNVSPGRTVGAGTHRVVLGSAGHLERPQST